MAKAYKWLASTTTLILLAIVAITIQAVSASITCYVDITLNPAGYRENTLKIYANAGSYRTYNIVQIIDEQGKVVYEFNFVGRRETMFLNIEGYRSGTYNVVLEVYNSSNKEQKLCRAVDSFTIGGSFDAPLALKTLIYNPWAQAAFVIGIFIVIAIYVAKSK